MQSSYAFTQFSGGLYCLFLYYFTIKQVVTTLLFLNKATVEFNGAGIVGILA
ncbi:hypothetical protein COEREDRAFT_83539 [Coemansia reversa NRRL 1564]|uniref:Uncharacterized protein n=1 Tax=Coemansia reversa (strain ATCC 12441 / NRRL 1564) TaxID=763665 RepID=A0A2G5B2W4_COERN|nr:hypothetical protein COEREDRAFT_83539 [Coemansia reversa NRRL 1564]|eukprot:PIA13358.1 hypothetical protein COEREDRAFT_83539 [Coemansia reversa NRRL 1564]